MGCKDDCTVAQGWTCTTSGTSPDFISTCIPTCGNTLVDNVAPNIEACDIGNSQHQKVVYNSANSGITITPNPSYDSSIPTTGCSADCLTVTTGYVCPAPG